MASSSNPAEVAAEGVYAQVKKYSTQWALSPIAPGVTTLALLSQLPTSRRLPNLYPRTFPLAITTIAMSASTYMSHAGYPIDGAGTMGAWSTLYLLMNTGVSRMGLRSSGASLRVGVAGLMLFNVVGGAGVYLAGWGGGRVLNDRKDGGVGL